MEQCNGLYDKYGAFIQNSRLKRKVPWTLLIEYSCLAGIRKEAIQPLATGILTEIPNLLKSSGLHLYIFASSNRISGFLEEIHRAVLRL
jgi:hypothetical protein